MNSFKKIALAVVAAMTMSTLVATSASAAPMQVTSVKKAGTTTTLGTAATTPITLPVPSDNSVDTADTVEFVVTVDTGTVVSVVATNAFVIPAVATSTAPVTASSGAATWSQNVGTGTTATFYVYTKTTAIGSVAITNGGTTTTYYVQGTSDKINSITVTGVDSAPAGTSVTVTIGAVDVFGNKLSGKSISAIANGATITPTSVTTGSGLTDFGTAEVKFVAPATGPVTIVAYAASADMGTAVTGFSTPSSSAVKVIAVTDLSAQVATLTAQLAAANAAKTTAETALAVANAEITKLKADAVAAKSAADVALAAEKAAHDATKAANAKALADLKKAFNALATKWNKANPKAKVTLVK
jgi:hypothetical protein